MSILRWKQKVMFADGGVLRDSGGGGGGAPAGPNSLRQVVAHNGAPAFPAKKKWGARGTDKLGRTRGGGATRRLSPRSS
jgi:hypothetical protein